MLSVRLQPSNKLTLLERTNIKDVMKEQDFGASNRVKKGTNARIGRLSGADVMLYGDIVIFGRDDTTKRKGLGAVIGRVLAGGRRGRHDEQGREGGGRHQLSVSSTPRPESRSRRRKPAANRRARARTTRASSVSPERGAAGGRREHDQLELPADHHRRGDVERRRPRSSKYLEGKVPAAAGQAARDRRTRRDRDDGWRTPDGRHRSDGVMRGDRFEILKINGEIKDPTTKEVIDLDAVKIGEFVVDTIREKTATGAYGGQPLSSAYATTGKGYAARLMTK